MLKWWQKGGQKELPEKTSIRTIGAPLRSASSFLSPTHPLPSCTRMLERILPRSARRWAVAILCAPVPTALAAPSLATAAVVVLGVLTAVVVLLVVVRAATVVAVAVLALVAVAQVAPAPLLPCCSGASSSWVSLSSMVLVRCFTCRSSFSCSVSPRRLRFSPVAGPLRSGSVRILRKAMLSVSVSIGGATCMWVAQWRTSRKHNGALLAGLPSLASLRLGRRTVPHLERTAGELRDQRTARSGAIRRSGVRSTNISNEIRHHAPHRPALRVIWGDGTSPQRCMAAASKTAAQASMEAGILPSSQMTHRRTGCARREVAANAVLFVHEEYMRSCQKHRTHISACCQCTCARQNITDRCKRTPFRLGCGAMGAW